ncbi:MAG: T9SS type A sorting domain-containing protein [Bacteroidota bacterium]
MYQDIVIKSGGVLTVTGEILMPYEGKLIIERGGKLVIDGGKIKCSSADKQWKGIEIWGTPDKTQYLSDLPYQGQIEILNGGSIENAEVAVYLGKRNSQGNYISGFEGGLFKATNATFKNNKVVTVFQPYHNYAPGNPYLLKPNLSFFKKCIFETNSSWNFPNTYPDAFVKLYEVEGIVFSGCTFQNTAPANFAVYNRGKGIYAMDAYFFIDKYTTTNPTTTTYCIFNNLYYAIDATKTWWDNTLSINNTVFNSNYRSIYINGILTPKITNNTFNIPDFDINITVVLPTNNQPYGLYLDASTGYTVENNSFNSSTANRSSKYGAIINFSGSANNRIYRNTFNNMYVGSSAQGNNRGTGTGLVFKCNEYTNCGKDISMGPYSRFVGAASLYQGSLTEPAANLFSHAGTPQSDIYNESWTINYYHNATATPIPFWVPINYSTPVFLYNTNITYNKTLQCPITGSGGSSKNIANSYSNIQSITTEIATIDHQLSNLIDGGNTNLLINEVSNSPSWDALNLRNNLLNNSPFLSDTVLISTVENESAMPPLMLTQVLTANPQAIKSENIKERIENRQNTIPQYLMNQIENSGKSISAKENFESNALMLRNKRANIIYSLIAELKEDTLNKYAVDSICNLLKIETSNTTLFNQYLLMLQSNRTNSAFEYLNQINEKNDADLSFLAAIVYDIKLNVKKIDSLSIQDINRLTQITSNEESSNSNIARSLLLRANKINYAEPINDITQISKGKRVSNIKTDQDNNTRLKIYPNPAKEWVIVYYKVESVPSKIEICDLLGKVVLSKVVEQSEGEILIETSSLTSGSYILKLQSDDNTLRTIKLTISN